MERGKIKNLKGLIPHLKKTAIIEKMNHDLEALAEDEEPAPRKKAVRMNPRPAKNKKG